DQPNGGSDSFAQFSVTPGREYYVLVTGSNPDLHFGNYTVTVAVAPTDDHPNRLDFPLGTVIDMTVNPLTQSSSGSADGELEVADDNDLFTFTATISGTATVTLTGRNGDGAPAVTILSNTNVVIASAADGMGPTMVTFNVTVGTTYYI